MEFAQIVMLSAFASFAILNAIAAAPGGPGLLSGLFSPESPSLGKQHPDNVHQLLRRYYMPQNENPMGLFPSPNFQQYPNLDGFFGRAGLMPGNMPSYQDAMLPNFLTQGRSSSFGAAPHGGGSPHFMMERYASSYDVPNFRQLQGSPLERTSQTSPGSALSGLRSQLVEVAPRAIPENRQLVASQQATVTSVESSKQ